jgi:hypothetical protein
MHGSMVRTVLNYPHRGLHSLSIRRLWRPKPRRVGITPMCSRARPPRHPHRCGSSSSLARTTEFPGQIVVSIVRHRHTSRVERVHLRSQLRLFGARVLGSLRVILNKTANSFHENILSTYTFTKSPSIFNENLQDNHLQFPACHADHLFVFIIFF